MIEDQVEEMNLFNIPTKEELLAESKLHVWKEFALVTLQTSPFVFDCTKRNFDPREVIDIANIMLNEWEAKREELMKDTGGKRAVA